MKTIVVMSGGMDSATLLYYLLDKQHEIKALSIDYGQRHLREIASAKEICSRIGVSIEVIHIPGLFSIEGGGALVDLETDVPEGHYEDESMKATVVPNRNMVFLSIALARCASLGYDAVAYGAHSGDHAIYPDCRPGFAAAMNVVASLCDFAPYSVLCPFVDMSKAEIVLLGQRLKVPYELTWTCYKGDKVPCGKCGACVERAGAFGFAGIKDPVFRGEAGEWR